MTVVFTAKGIREAKTKFSERQLKDIERTSERFRQDMLAKHDLFGKQAPHMVQIKY